MSQKEVRKKKVSVSVYRAVMECSYGGTVGGSADHCCVGASWEGR